MLKTERILIEGITFKIYMLFAGWEVRMVKTCDRGLETHPDPNPSSYNLESTFKSMGHLLFIHKLAILILCEID